MRSDRPLPSCAAPDGKLGPHERALARCALDPQLAVQRLDAVAQAAEAGAAIGVGATDAVVRDLDLDSAVGALDAHRGRVGAGMLDDVGERLGDGVVRRRLDLLGQALGQAHVEGRPRAAPAPPAPRAQRSSPRSVSTAGWMPCASSRSSVSAWASSFENSSSRRSASAGDVRSFAWASRSPSESATSRCCAPSCRLRSSRRRSVSLASTMRRREAASSSRAWALATARPTSSANACRRRSVSSGRLSSRRRATTSAPQVAPATVIGTPTLPRKPRARSFAAPGPTSSS